MSEAIWPMSIPLKNIHTQYKERSLEILKGKRRGREVQGPLYQTRSVIGHAGNYHIG